jgi:transcriptional regulator with XRE-family HTH domain
MNLEFLFRRDGVTLEIVAEAAGVHVTTASRWKTGSRRARWEHITKLHARGLLTDDDLRAGGLAIPRRTEAVAG